MIASRHFDLVHCSERTNFGWRNSQADPGILKKKTHAYESEVAPAQLAKRARPHPESDQKYINPGGDGAIL